MSNIHTIYLVHHSHTDVGYTHDQPIVWELQTRFIDEALNLAEKYADHQTDGAFRWTVETTSVLQRWLKTASQPDIERFQAMEKAGRIEVTGMFANLTPLLDTDELIESFQVLRSLRENYGFTIQAAMNCDVNGENWPLVDLLLDLGIEGFTMAINSHFGGPLKPRPHTFQWQGPSGRSIMVNNGWPYDKGWREGIGRDAEEFETVRWPRLQQYLGEIEYPLPILLIQSYHPYGDNGSAYDFTPFIDTWNNAGKSPRIVMATPRIWWQAVSEHQALLETLRGDWTDFWNFGSVSSAREQTINRASRSRLRAADALYAAGKSLGNESTWADQSFERYREEAWQSLILWDEHTWGADLSIREPYSEDAAAQWQHKANYAYVARSLSLMLQRDALADLARHVARNNDDDVLVFNPLPFSRTVSGDVPYFVLSPRGGAADTTAGRHHQDRDASLSDAWTQEDRYLLPPTEVPAFGYTVIARDQLLKREKPAFREDATVENHRYRVVFDRDTGGITSLYDRQLDWEWVDQEAEFALNHFVHEQVADTSHSWPRKLLADQDWRAPLAEIPIGWQTGWRAKRTQPTSVIAHRVYRTPSGTVIEQELDAPGIASTLKQRVFLPDFADYVECESWWEMGLTTHPEATYIMFPFNVPGATARFDLGGQAVIPGEEQLPGVCRDYFTAQGWVDFSSPKRGVTVAIPENPMIQLGDFHFGHYQQEFNLERAMLLGWVTNNYWETNFRAHQPGRVRARYRILPYDGGFDEGRAHLFGMEAASDPVFQQLGEAAVDASALPGQGTLLHLPESPVLTLRVKYAEDGNGIIVRLLNASDDAQVAEVKSDLLRITQAWLCDLLETNTGEQTVSDGVLSVQMSPRQIVTVRLVTG